MDKTFPYFLGMLVFCLLIYLFHTLEAIWGQSCVQ